MFSTSGSEAQLPARRPPVGWEGITVVEAGPGRVPRLQIADPDRPGVSVIVPTRNEAGNVAALLERVASVPDGLVEEVVFVDDSDDHTPEVVLDEGTGWPFRVVLVHRARGWRTEGLSGAVLEGFRVASAPWMCVIDGDLQHPPEVILDLLCQGLASDADVVCATRYRPGGSGAALGPVRTLVSRSSGLLAKALFPWRLRGISDPMSGFFMVRRQALDLRTFRPTGFKILLEILVRTPGLTRAEVAYRFAGRHADESKASAKEGLRYLRHLGRLRASPVTDRLPSGPALRFGAVGASGIALNNAVLWLLVALAGLGYLPGAMLSAQAAIIWNFALTEAWVFPAPGRAAGRARRFGQFLAASNAIQLAGIPLLALLVSGLGVHYLAANLATITALFVARFAVSRSLIWRDAPVRPDAGADRPAGFELVEGATRAAGGRRWFVPKERSA